MGGTTGGMPEDMGELLQNGGAIEGGNPAGGGNPAEGAQESTGAGNQFSGIEQPAEAPVA